MGIGRTVFYTSGLVGFGGYFLVHRELNKLYPDIPVYELPPNSRIRTVFDFSKKDPSKNVPYCDTYKITISTSKDVKGITEEFLHSPFLQQIISNFTDAQNPSVYKSSVFKTDSLDRKLKNNQYESTLIKWGFASPSLTSFFETIAAYGYPWRLMNGGYHEIYVEKLKNNTTEPREVYDVYFASAHEYNNLRDGKTIPRWVQSIHRDYARLLLHLSLSKYSLN